MTKKVSGYNMSLLERELLASLAQDVANLRTAYQGLLAKLDTDAGGSGLTASNVSGQSAPALVVVP